MLPMLERELADKRKWTTRDTLYDYYAIGQCTPGIISVNVATFVGYTQAGFLGSVCATAGIVTPSVIVITIIAAFLQNFTDIPGVQKALRGINVAVAALLTTAVWSFGKKSIKDAAGLALFALAFGAMFFLKANSALVLLGAALAGVGLSALRARKAAGGAQSGQTPEGSRSGGPGVSNPKGGDDGPD